MYRSEDTVKGISDEYSYNSAGNALSLVIKSMLNRINTAIPVRVDKVISASSADGPAGWVNATPLICELDGWNQCIEPVYIPKIPYFRLQSGKAAIVMDPQVGDVGLAVFAERSCDLLKQGEQDPRPRQPGFYRRFSMADGFYLGGFLGQTPETFIELKPEANSIRIHSPEKVLVECKQAEISAPEGTTFNGDVRINGSITWTGEALGDGLGGPAKFKNGIATRNGIRNTGGKVKSNGVSLEDHTHGKVQSGFNTTAGPVGRMEANDALREEVFSTLTDPKDKLILCLPEIAAAEYERASQQDKPGWELFQEAINKWLNLPAYALKDEYDNGSQEPAWVEWDWLMQYGRFHETVEGMVTRLLPPYMYPDGNYLFGPKARIRLWEVMDEEEFGLPGTTKPFDHINDLSWQDLRAHAFQSRPMHSFEGTWGTPNFNPDGLAFIGQLTLYALAKGYTKVDLAGKRSIHVEEVGLFLYDGFEFSGEQGRFGLGWWDCEGKKFTPQGEKLGNPDFRSFRQRTGYGCDFRIMCRPEVFSMQELYGKPEVAI